MTPEMAFECLLVSKDDGVLALMRDVLERRSIEIKICANSVKALEILSERNPDLVVCEWKGEPGDKKLLSEIATSAQRKPTVMTVVEDPAAAARAKDAGAHVVLQKPLTQQSSSLGLKSAYSRMVREERRNARFAIMTFAVAKTETGERLPVTVMDISERGVGLLTKQKIEVGELLNLDLALPNITRTINVEVRVLWVGEYNLVGADFIRVSHADQQLLHGWLAVRSSTGVGPRTNQSDSSGYKV